MRLRAENLRLRRKTPPGARPWRVPNVLRNIDTSIDMDVDVEYGYMLQVKDMPYAILGIPA